MRMIVNFGDGKSIEVEGKDTTEFKFALDWAQSMLKVN
jgi:hypothetical protein